jgi:hypothetical protein
MQSNLAIWDSTEYYPDSSLKGPSSKDTWMTLEGIYHYSALDQRGRWQVRSKPLPRIHRVEGIFKWR